MFSYLFGKKNEDVFVEYFFDKHKWAIMQNLIKYPGFGSKSRKTIREIKFKNYS